MRVRIGPGLNRLTRTLSWPSRPHRSAPALERGLGDRIGAPIGACGVPRCRSDETPRARRRSAQQRIERADQPPVGGDVDAITSCKTLGSTWPSGDSGAEDAGIADQHVEPPVALVERGAEPVDAVVVAQVERHQGGGAAGGLIASSSSSSPPTVRATATTCAPARASASAVAWPMPREAPVTSAMRSARGLVSDIRGRPCARIQVIPRC